MASRIFDDSNSFYAELADYHVPVTPKTRDIYNMVTHRFDIRGDYSVESLKKAEKSFLTLKEIFQREYSDAFIVEQDKPMSRIANISARDCGENKLSYGYRMVDLSLFTLNLQNGKIYNFPISQIEKTFNIDIDPKKKLNRDGGNKGYSFKQGINFLSYTKELIAKIFEDKGYAMTDEHFAKILCLSRLHRSNVIVYNIDGWIEYIVADKTIGTIIFGFSREFFGSGKLHFIPVNEVEEYESLPREWLKNIFGTLQKKEVFEF